jgi:hypothetical protein
MKVMSYNTLADKWVVYKEDDPTTHKLKYRYGFIPDEDKENILGFKNRLERIINKIKLHDPDIVCLQEVELAYTEANFINNLPEYDNIHHVIWKKGDDKSLYKRTNDIGNITLWKKDKFKCLTDIKDAYNSCAIFTELLHIDTNFQFLIINVHLIAGLSTNAETRAKQIISCCKKMKNGVPTCICGDFNEELNINSPNKDVPYVKDILEKHNFNIPQLQTTCDVYWHETKTHYYHAFDHAISCGLKIDVDKCPDANPIPNMDEPSDHYALVFNIKM